MTECGRSPLTGGRLDLWIPGASMGVVMATARACRGACLSNKPLQNFRKNPVELTTKLKLSPNLPRRRRRRRRPLVVRRRELLR